jgi:hypothetical protein
LTTVLFTFWWHTNEAWRPYLNLNLGNMAIMDIPIACSLTVAELAERRSAIFNYADFLHL